MGGLKKNQKFCSLFVFHEVQIKGIYHAKILNNKNFRNVFYVGKEDKSK